MEETNCLFVPLLFSDPFFGACLFLHYSEGKYGDCFCECVYFLNEFS